MTKAYFSFIFLIRIRKFSWGSGKTVSWIRRAPCKSDGMTTDSSKQLWYFIFRCTVEATSSNAARKVLPKLKFVNTFTRDHQVKHLVIHMFLLSLMEIDNSLVLQGWVTIIECLETLTSIQHKVFFVQPQSYKHTIVQDISRTFVVDKDSWVCAVTHDDGHH